MTHGARITLMAVAANLAVYFVMLICWLLRGVFPSLPDTATALLALPADISTAISVPWTALTHIFTHISFVHLTVNMLWLLGFGAIIKGGWHRMALTYLSGGLAGGAAFLAYSTIAGTPDGTLAGASAATAAIVVAAAITSPARKLRLFFAGDVSIRWIAPLAILTMFAGSPVFSAVTAAHLGGIFAGSCAGIIMRTRDRAFSKKALEKARAATRRRKLIEKAGTSGFAALSEAERHELFDLSSAQPAT